MKYCKNYLNYKIIESMKRFGFKSPVLEIGCGTGETMDALTKEYAINGVDLSSEAVSICITKGLNVRKDNFLNITESFNSIVCADVLEHIEDDDAFIKHMYKILNNNGKVFIMVPSGRMMDDDLFCGHYRRYSRDSITELLKKNNFIIEAVEMFGYPIIYYTRLLMNFFCKVTIEEGLNLRKQTLKSSYDGPFDRAISARIFGKITKIGVISGLLLRFLLLQDFFANGNKGFAIIVITRKI